MTGFQLSILALLALALIMLALVIVRVWSAKDMAPFLEKFEGLSARLAEGFASNQTGFSGLREELRTQTAYLVKSYRSASTKLAVIWPTPSP